MVGGVVGVGSLGVGGIGEVGVGEGVDCHCHCGVEPAVGFVAVTGCQREPEQELVGDLGEKHKVLICGHSHGGHGGRFVYLRPRCQKP